MLKGGCPGPAQAGLGRGELWWSLRDMAQDRSIWSCCQRTGHMGGCGLAQSLRKLVLLLAVTGSWDETAHSYLWDTLAQGPRWPIMVHGPD